MTASGCAMRRELLVDLLDDARRLILAGDDRGEALAAHILAFEPLQAAFAKLAPLVVHPRDRAEARRTLARLQG